MNSIDSNYNSSKLYQKELDQEQLFPFASSKVFKKSCPVCAHLKFKFMVITPTFTAYMSLTLK